METPAGNSNLDQQHPDPHLTYALAGRKPIDSLGEYDVYDVLRGGMGEVFVVSLPQMSFATALKTFQKRLSLNIPAMNAFKREAELWIRLSGLPHILPAFGVVHIDGRLFVSTLFVPANENGIVSLRDRILKGAIEPADVLRYAKGVAQGLAAAQERFPGLVHGDLKPGNLLLIMDSVHISDFGLARISAQLHKDEAMDSTWAYQAPECFESPSSASEASDLYSFGCTLWELLSGGRPFQATGRSEWAAKHLSETLQPPKRPRNIDGKQAVLWERLAAIAMNCLAKDARNRPPSFSGVAEELMEITQNSEITSIQSKQNIDGIFAMVGNLVTAISRPQRISALLESGNAKSALVELDAMNPDSFDGEMWGLRAHALSMLNRDEEAIASFERALSIGVTGKKLASIGNGYAISLKRTSKPEEAERVLMDLLPTVDQSQLVVIQATLALLFADTERLPEARSLLAELTHSKPNDAKLWFNLGQICCELGDPAQGRSALERAVALDKKMSVAHYYLACIYLDYFGNASQALIGFNNLIVAEQEVSMDWLCRVQECHIRLGREDLRSRFSSLLVDRLPQDEARRVEEEAARQALIDKPLTPPNSPPQEKNHPPYVGSTFSVQLHPDEGSYTIEFCDDTTKESYAQDFCRHWLLTQRDPRRRAGLPFMASPQPFYFAACTNCLADTLTNRYIGENFNCRKCGSKQLSATNDQLRHTELVANIETDLGLERVTHEGHLLLVTVQSLVKNKEVDIRAMCTKHGFQSLPQDHPAIHHLYVSGRFTMATSGVGMPTFWSKTANTNAEVYAHTAPRELVDLIRELRTQICPVATQTMSVDPGDESFFSMVLQGRYQELLERSDQALGMDPSDSNALGQKSSVLVNMGRIYEANDCVQLWTSTRPGDVNAHAAEAGIAFRMKDFKRTVEACNRTLAIDPTNSVVMTWMAEALEQLGRAQDAQQWRASARSFGGLQHRAF